MDGYIERTERGMICRGHIVNPVEGSIHDGEIRVVDGKIQSITHRDDVPKGAPYIMPGFIDSHVHIESSMILPEAFARVAVKHGMVGAVCDPHEIANVLGVDGVELMLRSAEKARFHFAFGAPSCVPSCGTDIETSGCRLDSRDVALLLKREDIYFLSEMMNFPGVLGKDAEVMAKIRAAKEVGKPIDGHAPGLRGELRQQYADAGISTDHECTELEEGRDCIKAGMHVLIREGSAATDYAVLAPLIRECPSNVMFCMDDCHPDDFLEGGVDRIVRRAMQDGYDLMDVLRSACVNPVRHYHLPVGLLHEGDAADFICVSDLTPDFRVLDTYIEGREVFSASSSMEKTENQPEEGEWLNIFNARPITTNDIAMTHEGQHHIIAAMDGSLFTKHEFDEVAEDVQKLVVYNRYISGAHPQVAYIRGFGLQHGAIAQTIAHDCHNIVAIGTSDELIVNAINSIVEMKGGIVATDGEEMALLNLPVAGIMSPLSVEEIVKCNRCLGSLVKNMGCPFRSPFITLAFMALPVIPELKLTDKGLFDSVAFDFVR